MRLFDRRRARWSDDAVHERVIVEGPTARLGGDLCMRPPSRSTPTSPSRTGTRRCRPTHCTRGATGAGALRVALSPLARFLRYYVLRLGFLDGVAGFAHIAIGAFASFLKYAKLRALDAEGRGR